MSKYSCINIIKTKAKKMVRSNTALTQVQALELIAQNSNFSSYHELIQVAKKTPLESRLLIAAFGDSDFKDVIYNLYGSCTDGPYPSLEIAVEGGGLGNGNFCTLSALFNQFKILTY
ncbi:hypothetical protein OGR29_004274 [Escherichia coli]|nr:hypothetical protein [Escherichia coli]